MIGGSLYQLGVVGGEGEKEEGTEKSKHTAGALQELCLSRATRVAYVTEKKYCIYSR